jgi:glutamate N-acetyltransferase/amino-acid N-acetyltransferase
MKNIEGGVCAPRGFRAGGIWCGIKAVSHGSASGNPIAEPQNHPHKRDLALIYSEKPCVSAAVFTRNKVKAAAVLVNMEHAAHGSLRAIIANSGNANACTGSDGLAAARKMADLIADELAISARDVAVCSTGVIGVPLPIAAIEAEASSLADSLQNDASGHEAALEAIMTTDTRKKGGAVEVEIGGKPVRIGAMVKGSGMIHPNMGTMLCFITTDAGISREMLDKALRGAVDRSFNRVTVDGDTSTNDTAIIMANGEAGNTQIAADDSDYAAFYGALEALCTGLARKMARDGEGATRLLTVTVTGAADEQAAEILAKSVAASNLVKAAIFGADANWGRVLCALGYADAKYGGKHGERDARGAPDKNAGAEFDPAAVDVSFASRAGEILVCKNGGPAAFSEEDAKKILLEEEVEIRAKVGTGAGAATVWGCDLTYDYVKINGDYRS